MGAPTMWAIDPVPGATDMPLQPVERPVPVPAPGEVLVRVAAAGLNGADRLQRRGLYPPPPGASSVLGLELAGEVVGLGAGADPAWLGLRVCAIVAGGGQAEYAVVDQRHLLRVPDSMDDTAAGAICETLFTVWSNVFERARAQPGEWLLCHGGGSGIGTMALTLARAFEIPIIVTCGGAARCAAVATLGAPYVIDHKAEDLVTRVQEITNGHGVDIVLDMVGGETFARNLACLADDGRHVSISVLGGPKAALFLPEVMRKRLTITGSTLRPRTAEFKAALTRNIAQTVWPRVQDGTVRPVVDSAFPLKDAAGAHARLESGDHVGKVVLTFP